MVLSAVVMEGKEAYAIERKNPAYDALWKKIIEDLFAEFMLFFAPDLFHLIDFTRRPEFFKQGTLSGIVGRG